MADRELDELRAEAELLGVGVDRRWGVDRLRDEIAAAKADDGDDQAEAAAVDDAPADAKRAGGWVNRDDGAGWVLEDGD